MEQSIAEGLLEINAVTLNPQNPYTWASGMLSPIYCDNRLTISNPILRNKITDGFVIKIRHLFPDVDAIVGTATAGIPQACWVADRMNLPMAYVRAQSKGHGRAKQIEGALLAGSRVVVIEDLISTGGSSIKACQTLQESGIQVLGVLAIFTYELDSAIKNFEDANLKIECLSNYSTLVHVARSSGYIDDVDVNLLKAWRKDPQNYQIKNDPK